MEIAKILVVDDDAAIRGMVAIILETSGFEVVFCEDGSSALQVFTNEKPDMVLLDWMLPGKDGVEVCKEIRAVAGTPVLMLTAKSETEDMQKGLEAGADDFLTKPLDDTALFARVRSLARLKAMTDELRSRAVASVSSGSYQLPRSPSVRMVTGWPQVGQVVMAYLR